MGIAGSGIGRPSHGRNPHNNNMSRSDEDSESLSDLSENESDLASILQFLIRSGQVRILSSGHVSNSLVEPLPTHTSNGSNLENFHKSEMCLITKQSSGLLHTRPSNSLTDMILKRASGRLKGGGGFSNADKCSIYNVHLPVKMNIIDTYESKAFSGIYSHDGNLLLTASQDRYLRLYDSSNGCVFKLIKNIQGRDVGWSVLGTAFSPDSSRLAYSSWSSSVCLVYLDDDCYAQTSLDLCPEERRFSVFSVQFSNGGNEILCGANDGHLYIYDLGVGMRTLRVKGHSDDLNTVAFADNTSQILYSGGDDGLCKVWDRRTLCESSPHPVGVLAGHLDGVIYIDSRGDARHLISNSKDQSIKLWDIRVFSDGIAQENTRKAVRMNKWDYRWQTAPKKLVNRKTNLKGDTSLATYRGHSVLQTQIRCHFSPAFTTGQRYIYTGCAFGQVIVYDILTGSMSLKLQGHSSCVRDVSWHPFRPEIISSSWDFSVICWSQFSPKSMDGDKYFQEAHDGDDCDVQPFVQYENTEGLRRSKRIADRNRSNS